MQIGPLGSQAQGLLEPGRRFGMQPQVAQNLRQLTAKLQIPPLDLIGSKQDVACVLEVAQRPGRTGALEQIIRLPVPGRGGSSQGGPCLGVSAQSPKGQPHPEPAFGPVGMQVQGPAVTPQSQFRFFQAFVDLGQDKGRFVVGRIQAGGNPQTSGRLIQAPQGHHRAPQRQRNEGIARVAHH